MIPKPNYVRVLTHFPGFGVWSPLGKAGMPAPACFRLVAGRLRAPTPSAGGSCFFSSLHQLSHVGGLKLAKVVIPQISANPTNQGFIP